MADLEALTRIDPVAGANSNRAPPGQYRWRYMLPEKRVLRLGSDPAHCDWVVSEDRMISRFHATLEWDGSALTVTRRGALLPEFPNPPQNQIWFHNKPVEQCTVRPGEWFVIGQTRFTLRGEADDLRPRPPAYTIRAAGAPATVMAGAQPVPDYMAPEQINESADNPPSPATDLHAVGVMLFQMLTGELPFPQELAEWARLEAIVKRRFATCEKRCQTNGYGSRLAPLIDRCLQGGEYRQARFLLRDLLGATEPPTAPPSLPVPVPTADEPFVIGPFLFEDRWSEAFAASGAESGAPVTLRLVKPKYDGGEVGELIRRLVPTPDDVPDGFLRRYRVGRGSPLPVHVGTRFSVDSAADGCLVVVEEFVGNRTLLAAIEGSAFVGNDDAVLRVAVPLLEVLDYVHARGAIHARLTPHCVFLSETGGVKIEGFGSFHRPERSRGQLSIGVHADVDAIRLNQGGDPDGGMSITTLNPADDAAGAKRAENAIPVPARAALGELTALASLAQCQTVDDVYRVALRACLGFFPFVESAHVLRVTATGRIESLRDEARPGAPPFGEGRGGHELAAQVAGSGRTAAGDDESAPAICARVDGDSRTVIQLRTQTRGKPFGADHLGLLDAVGRLAVLAIQKVRLHEEALTGRALLREFELARAVQLTMLPRVPPDVPGYEFHAHYSPAQTLGGEYYDFVALPGGRVAVVLAEVAGRSVSAALAVAALTSEARWCLESEPDPARAVARLNDRLIRGGTGDRFVVFVVAVLDPAAHRVVLVSAGHQSPKLHRAATGDVSDAVSLDATGLPLAVLPEFVYERVDLALEPGDAVVMFTDGVTDVLNPSGECFGPDSAHKAVTGASDGPRGLGEGLVAALRAHANGRPQGDDITVVCFGRTGGRA